MDELPIIQKTYDLLLWYLPILARLPREHRFTLGERMMVNIHDLLEHLVTARYASQKLRILVPLNSKLAILRYQTRLLLDLDIIRTQRYEYAVKLLNAIGAELGGWIKQRRQKESP